MVMESHFGGSDCCFDSKNKDGIYFFGEERTEVNIFKYVIYQVL